MKKYSIACATICLALAFAACSSSRETVYRKAYEKSQAQYDAQQKTQAQPATQQVSQTTVEQPVVTPLQEAPAQQVTAKSASGVQTESVKVVSGNGLKAYSVVVGSFSLRANADGVQNTLNNAGYQAQVVYNKEANMYRVVATTFDTKEAAESSRDNFRKTPAYEKAWILYQK